jgi:signal transduction histidine kinase
MTDIFLRNRIIYSIILLIAILLGLNGLFTITSGHKIQEQAEAQSLAESIKLNTNEVIRHIHLLDVGLRGYALSKNPSMLVPMDTANARKARLLNQLEEQLVIQNFPLEKFYSFRDDVETYFLSANRMRVMLVENETEKFNLVFDSTDYTYLWNNYTKFYIDLLAFQENVVKQSKQKYSTEMQLIQWMQWFVFLLVIPTLLYLAYYSTRTFTTALKLHSSEVQRAKLLANQNNLLEREVNIRTQELQAAAEEMAAQNEEIVSQSEEIASQNNLLSQHRDDLNKKHQLLTEQNQRLQAMQSVLENQNKMLHRQVGIQSEDLSKAYLDLQVRNQQLEQFTHMVSHNLRGPLTRILGLSSIFNGSDSITEQQDIALKIVQSSQDLDEVIKDLMQIVEMKKAETSLRKPIVLETVLQHVRDNLHAEISASHLFIRSEFSIASVYGVQEYIDNVFYQLMRNAVLYRDPEKHSTLVIRSYASSDGDVLEFEDNGLGIDLTLYGDKLFAPYKRFHFHVEGKGLGLYLIKTQMLTLGGKIDIESTVGQGTKFTLTFAKR